jgi:glyoxylase-like metal-dependent hydrolase (beta-lactamase superfamily II)
MSGPEAGDLGYLLVELRTPTLPPATTTNAWLVPAGRGGAAGDGLAVGDPGATDPGEQARLLARLDELEREGRPLREVWLTHAHPDHVGALQAVVARHRVPVRAHRLAAARVEVPISPVAEGDRLGRFRVLETPGHAREHLSFLDEEAGALLCGDMLSALSTMVIDPPEGDMAAYVRQLERLAQLGPRTLYPAHGPPLPDGARKLAEAVAHRRAREAQVLAAVAAPGTLEVVTARAYADTPAAFHALAARSCLAGLEKLRAEGKVEERAGVWRTV